MRHDVNVLNHSIFYHLADSMCGALDDHGSLSVGSFHLFDK